MYLLVCPGIHSPALTASFLQELQRHRNGNLSSIKILVFPAEIAPVYSGRHILQFLRESEVGNTPITAIAFSAGVVGAIAALRTWQRQGKAVRGFIALDGWGVPLAGNFPIYRLSHDYFTHWSSTLLGGGREGFYADPGVEHLQLWRSPQTVWGWWDRGSGKRSRCCASHCLSQLLQQCCEPQFGLKPFLD